MVNHQIKVLQALASAIAEGGRGVTGTAFPKQPVRALKLYEFEGSPFCRRVREVITLLNLDVEIYPCPKGGLKYRPIVKEIGGKLQFPFLLMKIQVTNYTNHKILFITYLSTMARHKTPDKFSNYPKCHIWRLPEHY